MENDRIVAAAKREARRRASADGTSLQRHLEDIALEAGRPHWSAYLKDPVEILPNPFDRLVRECFEDGYDGMEIEHLDDPSMMAPDGFRPAYVKAFMRSPDGSGPRVDLYRLGYDDLEYLSPSLRKRLESPSHNAAYDVRFGEETLFLYNHLGGQIAFTRVGAGWQAVHDTNFKDYDTTLELPYWRGRRGRTLAEVAGDDKLHARRVSRLKLVIASPVSPSIRYDPFALDEVPVINVELTRAHFRAVADIVLPHNADLAIDRHVFAEVATRRRGERMKCEWSDITVGLRHMSKLMRDTALTGDLPVAVQMLTPTALQSSVNRIATRLLRFAQGPLADAVDGDGQRLRAERARRTWENGIWKEFARVHPGKSPDSPEYRSWIDAASARADAPPDPYDRP